MFCPYCAKHQKKGAKKLLTFAVLEPSFTRLSFITIFSCYLKTICRLLLFYVNILKLTIIRELEHRSD